ncbi:MAG TPA: hypothetical protein VFR02_10080, partial [bacterium]|nr:hypothetical protein [bacterium]
SVNLKTVFTLFQESGLDFIVPARRQHVMDRVQRLRDLLKPDPLKKTHPMTQEYREEGWPTLLFTDECLDTIEEFENWELRGETSSEATVEKPEARNDHGIDAVSYALQGFWGEASPDHPLTRMMEAKDPSRKLREVLLNDLKKSLTPTPAANYTGDQVL